MLLCLIACFGSSPDRIGQASADRVNTKRGGVENAHNAAGERQNASRVDVVAEQCRHEFVDALGGEPRPCGPTARGLGRALFNSRRQGHALKNRPQIRKFPKDA